MTWAFGVIASALIFLAGYTYGFRHGKRSRQLVEIKVVHPGWFTSNICRNCKAQLRLWTKGELP